MGFNSGFKGLTDANIVTLAKHTP